MMGSYKDYLAARGLKTVWNGAGWVLVRLDTGESPWHRREEHPEAATHWPWLRGTPEGVHSEGSPRAQTPHGWLANPETARRVSELGKRRRLLALEVDQVVREAPAGYQSRERDQVEEER